MTTQQASLRQELEGQGWEVVEGHDFSLDWWADQVWTLKSKSSATKVCLTFVVDPQWKGPRQQGQGVWALTASLNGPKQWSDVTLNLGKGWQERLPQFLLDLRHNFSMSLKVTTQGASAWVFSLTLTLSRREKELHF